MAPDARKRDVDQKELAADSLDVADRQLLERYTGEPPLVQVAEHCPLRALISAIKPVGEIAQKLTLPMGPGTSALMIRLPSHIS